MIIPFIVNKNKTQSKIAANSFAFCHAIGEFSPKDFKKQKRTPKFMSMFSPMISWASGYCHACEPNTDTTC